MATLAVTSGILTHAETGFRGLDDFGEILTSRQTTIMPLPRWQSEALARLAELEGLSPNWDGYGGRPVTRRHANRAMTFLGRIMRDDLPPPEIVPLADGGVQLEWHLPHGRRLDFISDDDEPQPVIVVDAPQDAVEAAPVGDDTLVRAREMLVSSITPSAHD